MQKGTPNSVAVKMLVNETRKIRHHVSGVERNISIRFGRCILIKADGLLLKSLSKEDVVWVLDYNEEDNIATASDSKKPSLKMPMYWMVYQKFPNANVIVHVRNKTALNDQKAAEKAGAVLTQKIPLRDAGACPRGSIHS